MRKFTFPKKRNPAGDSSQEKLVEQYFDDLQLNDVETDRSVSFERAEVFNRIISVIDQPQRQKASVARRLMVAASFLAGLFFLSLTYYYRVALLNVIDPVSTKQLTAVNGQVINYTLADGTKVWLNGGSKLTYPDKFRGELREITLEGEAFLEVAHDAKKSFIVHTGSIRTQVLGTSFNVKAYPEQSFVKVDVASGKVGVMPAQNAPTVFLTPAEEVIVDKKTNTSLKAKNIDITLLTDWRDGGLTFKNAALGEVVNALEHRFNVKIKADNNLVKCSISANFTNVSLKNIMVIMSKLIKGKAIQGEDGYHLKGRGC